MRGPSAESIVELGAMLHEQVPRWCDVLRLAVLCFFSVSAIRNKASAISQYLTILPDARCRSPRVACLSRAAAHPRAAAGSEWRCHVALALASAERTHEQQIAVRVDGTRRVTVRARAT